MRSNSWQFDGYGEPKQVLHWRQQELPEPGPGQALVKIRAVGMNRSDLNYVLGRYFPAEQFPSCLGSEAVGEVVALGPPAEEGPQPLSRLQLRVGQRVGTLTARVDRARVGVYRDIGLYDQAALAPIPESYSDAEGAALWTAVLTMGGAMQMGGLTAASAAGKRVLITAAASGMGVLALKLAKCWGAATIATTRNSGKVERLKELADQVVVCGDSAGLVEGVNRASGGEGVDLVLDPVGTRYYQGLLAVCANGGDIVSYECITGTDADISIMEMMMKDVSYHGFTIFRVFNNQALLEDLVDIGMDNADRIRPLVSQTFDLQDAVSALDTLEQSEHLGKIVLTAD